ncbi:immunoglobulin-like domain-containing protein [Bacillus cereus]|uniref:LPXTG-domain-containing protein cell wall anchor domain n=3 Tax=Bacillus cereus TaxID=1396 RepID=J8E779_BACCE|nr:immunoglobulin-like domain-containing protein [Bacillus cereus]EJQ92826.1 LPXTG-domain-containing protein cell wall anchor domain [Bacillus cereus MC67]
MGNSTTKSKKLVGFVATATLATSMIAGVGNASAQTTDTLRVSEPVHEKAKDKKEERPESLFPYIDVNYETTIYVGDPFDPMAEVSAYDSKDGDITDKINIAGEVNPFEPGGYNLDYTVTNSRGFSVIKQVHVWVKRGEKPTLRLPYRVSINVGDKFDPMAGVSAIDEKDGDITSKIKVDGNVDTSKPGTYEVTYTVTNSKGLTIVRKQPVKVKETEGTKNEAPVLTVPFSTTLHVGEEFDPMAGVSATDKEDGNLTNKVKFKGNVDTSKPGKYIVEYWVVDSKGVNATATRSVIVKENEEIPDMEPKLTAPTKTTINVGDKFDPMAGVKAIDNEDGDITSKVTVDGNVDTSKPGTYELTYTVLDSKGHKVTTKQTVTVKQTVETKNEAPVLTVPVELILHVGDTFNPMQGVKAIDKEDGDITSKVICTGADEVDTSKPGKYILVYGVTDSQGENTIAVSNVYVMEKEETPDMEPKLAVPVGATINVGDKFDPMAGVSATDKEDGDITSKVTVDGSVDASKPGTYDLTYTVSDSKGHTVTAKQTVTVKQRVEPKDEVPVLTAPTQATINVGDKFNPLSGVKAIDKEDGDITSKVTVDGNVDTSRAGTYELTYTVLDSKEHKVTSKQTVTVKQKVETKNEAPVLTVPFTTTLRVGEKFDPMAGVSATDKEDGNLTNIIRYEGNVDTSKTGKYIVEYWVVDSKGVNATATQTVIVKENEKTPDMEPKLTVPTETTINVGDKFNPLSGVKAIDNEDGDITNKVIVDGSVDASKPGTYELTYKVTDSKGHTVTAKQTVTVKQTVVPKDEVPVLTVPTEVTIHVGDKYNPLSGVKAIDKEDGDITDKVIHMGEVDTSKAGNFEVKFLVRDTSGNEVTATQKVIVKDKGTENGSDNSYNNTNTGNVSDNNNTSSTLDNKKDTIKELPKTGASSNNGTTVGILAILAGMLITFGRKFKKAIK